MNKLLAEIRKGIQKGLSHPDSLFWSFDSQDRAGEPYRVFLDLNYRGNSIVIEWRRWEEDRLGISRHDPHNYTHQHDFVVTGVDAAITKALELLEGGNDKAATD